MTDWKANYTCLREIPEQGLCGLCPMLSTVGLFCQLTEIGYAYRYCYENYADARHAILNWNGEGDPPGPWIKKKP